MIYDYIFTFYGRDMEEFIFRIWTRQILFQTLNTCRAHISIGPYSWYSTL